MVEVVDLEEKSMTLVARVVGFVAKVILMELVSRKFVIMTRRKVTPSLCGKLTGKPTQPTQATHIASIQEESHASSSNDNVKQRV